MSMRAKNRTKSSWTPLSDGATNNKLYEERRGLVTKWFDRWTDDQRKKVFDELIRKCKPKQLDYLRCVVNDRAPVHRQDFTSVLPRVISLYIFSFLDPRSLSRSSQVCWYWKFLTELDVLWMAKCLRLGWYLTYTPSPYETGMWKKNYIEHIQSLQALRPQSPNIKQRMNNLSPRSSRKGGRDGGVGGVGGGHGKDKNKTPWRGSDPVPTDTYRYNILDNNDVIEEINKQRKKKMYGEEASRLAETVRSKVNTGNNVLRSMSASRLYSTTGGMNNARPNSRVDYSKKKHQTVQIIDVPRPGPVSPPPKTPRSPKRSPTRSARDPPSSNLFPTKAWDLPEYDSDN